MRIIGFIAYWVLAITQLLGVYEYFGNVLEWNSLLSGVLALFLCGIPILGTILGVMGATQGWGWDIIPALALYLWPFIIFGLVYFISYVIPRNRT